MPKPLLRRYFLRSTFGKRYRCGRKNELFPEASKVRTDDTIFFVVSKLRTCPLGFLISALYLKLCSKKWFSKKLCGGISILASSANFARKTRKPTHTPGVRTKLYAQNKEFPGVRMSIGAIAAMLLSRVFWRSKPTRRVFCTKRSPEKLFRIVKGA